MGIAPGQGQRQRQLLLGAAGIAEPLLEQPRQPILSVDAIGDPRRLSAPTRDRLRRAEPGFVLAWIEGHRRLGQDGDQTAEQVRRGVPSAALLVQAAEAVERPTVPRLVPQHLQVGVAELTDVRAGALALAPQDLDVAIPAPLTAVEILEQRQRAPVLRRQRQRGLGGPGGLLELRASGLVPEGDLHPQVGRLLVILEAARNLGGGGHELAPKSVTARDPFHFLDHAPAGGILGQSGLQRHERPARIPQPALVELGHPTEHGRALGSSRRRLGLHQQLVDPRGPFFDRRLLLHRRLGIEGVGAHPVHSLSDH